MMLLRRLRWLVLLVPVIFLLPGLGQFAYPPGGAYSDLAISHYPNALFLQRWVWQGVVPLWSGTILSGYPFAADPLAGLWYPPGWLALLLPLPLGLNLLVVLHLVWGGWGMYRLLRSEGVDEGAAWAGALLFEGMPKVLAHYAAGHVSLLFAISWTPWVLWAERRSRQGARFSPLAGVCLGLLLLADVRWGAYAGLLWAGYVIWLPGQRRYCLGDAIRTCGLALALSAPLLLALVEYTRLSTRQAMAAADVLAFSLPPGRLAGLLAPDIGGYAEWILYPGAVGLLLTLWLGMLRGGRRYTFWWGVLVLSLVMALGETVPGMSWLAHLPIFGLLRVPARALFLTGMAFAVLAAWGAQSFEAGAWCNERRRVDPIFPLVMVAAFGAAFAGGVWWVMGRPSLNFVWGAAALVVTLTGIVLARLGRLEGSAWRVFVAVVVLGDLGGVNLQAVRFRPVEAVLAEGGTAAAYLAQQPGLFRVYSPSYRLGQQTAAFWGLQLADGIAPLHLEAYARYMETASGVPRQGYSVTVPPLAGDDLAQANRRYRPDARALGVLNVRYLVADYDLSDPDLRLVRQFGVSRLYENLQVQPRAWVQGAAPTAVKRLDWSPNRVDVIADGPGLLVLSEIVYPGWQVWVDGQPAQMETVYGLLRAVTLAAGEHTISFVFRPLWGWLGAAIAGCVWLTLAVYCRRLPGWFRRKNDVG